MPSSGPTKPTSRTLGSLASLCSALDITEFELNAALDLPNIDKYTSKPIPKKNGKIRVVYKPHKQIRKIQKRIKNRLFINFHWPSHLYGSVRNQPDDTDGYVNRDYIACASRHCRAKSVLSVDIENFFDNIHKDRVAYIFQKVFHFDAITSEKLAGICTYNDHVVQGGLTSSYLANLALFDVESAAIEKLHRKNLVYTRLVDDITVSSKVGHYNFDYAIRTIQKVLLDAELPMNHEKTTIQYVTTAPIIIHGLRIGFSEPRLLADEVNRIRAATHSIEKLAALRNYRTTFSFRKDFNRCMGRVNKLARVKHNQHTPLLNRLRAVLPLPSKMDIVKAKEILTKLEKDFSARGSEFWYRRRYFRLAERINTIARTYNFSANRLRTRMSLVRPLDAK